jgi:hypothetical protein
MTSAKLKPFYTTRGDSYREQLLFKSDGVHLDLSEMQDIEMTIRSGISTGSPAVLNFSLNNGIELGGESNSVLIFTADASTTSDIRGGIYYRDLKFIDKYGDTYRVAHGEVRFREKITI